MTSTIFVTGATGQTGSNVCERLTERGDHVRALVRDPDEATATAATDPVVARTRSAELSHHVE